MSPGSAQLWIGTSGWSYDHWQGPFYPPGLPQEDWLSYYQEHFDTVEINNTFYQLPAENTFQRWRQHAPPGFRYAVKANRYITHLKNLKDPQEPLENFLRGVNVLGEDLGPILFQLPPDWDYNHRRLAAFLEVLPEGHRYSFELRDLDWINDRTLQLLEEHRAAFCIYDYQGRTTPRVVTADFIYLRLHGPTPEAYQGRYTTEDLAGWAGAFSSWLEQGKDVYCYFDNDIQGYAVDNARELKSMLVG